MKKTVLLVAIVLAGITSSFAQTSAGNVMAGGSFGFSSTGGEVVNGNTTNQKNTTTSFSIIPRAGYFISDGLAVGTGIGFSSQKTTDPDDNYISSSLFQISPFARYYVSLGEKVSLYGEGAVNLGFGGSKAVAGGTEIDTGDVSAFGIAVSPGINYFITDRLGLDIGFSLISFSNTNQKDPTDDSENKTNNFSFGFDSFSPNFGIYFFF